MMNCGVKGVLPRYMIMGGFSYEYEGQSDYDVHDLFD